MNQYKTSSELKNIARYKLRGKYGSAMLVSPLIQFAVAMAVFVPLILMLFLLFVIISIANNFETNTLAFTLSVYLVMIPFTALLGVMNTGVSLFYLNIACGRKHSVADIFYGFRAQFKKSLALSAVITLANYACMLPYQILNFLPFHASQTEWILLFLSYIGGNLIFLPIQLSLSQCFYLLLDFPDYSTLELLKLSVRIMKGHKLRLFYIQLSFIPLQILCILSFYIGYLWGIPYMNMTNALFFLDIMKPQPSETTSCDSFSN